MADRLSINGRLSGSHAMRNRYDHDVKLVGRVLAVALTLAIGIAPTLLDSCLLTCVSHAAAAASKLQAGHACHRIQHSGAQPNLRDPSTHCCHDHTQSGAADDPSPSVGPSATKIATSLRMAHAMPATVASVDAVTNLVGLMSRAPGSPPDRACLRPSPLPLRI